MRFFEMGLAFAALGFLVGNAVLSLLTILLWRALRSSVRGAGGLFLIRMAPAIGSLVLVLGVVVPAFLVFEPRATTERAGPGLVVFVVAACALIVVGLCRAAASWRHTLRLARGWRNAAGSSVSAGMPVPAYRVPSAFPFAALVGVLRPRLYVSDRFMDALSADERQAVVDHEAGHLRSRDNLKRVLMRLAPDWLSFTASGREIEAAWAIAAEEAADDHAAGPGRIRSLDLAGALLKAARLMPMSCAPVSNFCEGATIARRVERLLNDPPAGAASAPSAASWAAWGAVLLGAAALLAGPVLPAAYAMTEAALHLLQ